MSTPASSRLTTPAVCPPRHRTFHALISRLGTSSSCDLPHVISDVELYFATAHVIGVQYQVILVVQFYLDPRILGEYNDILPYRNVSRTRQSPQPRPSVVSPLAVPGNTMPEGSPRGRPFQFNARSPSGLNFIYLVSLKIFD